MRKVFHVVIATYEQAVDFLDGLEGFAGRTTSGSTDEVFKELEEEIKEVFEIDRQ